jgi:hypothetical protein
MGLARSGRHVAGACRRRAIDMLDRAPRTLLQKIWDQHEVSAETADTPAVLYIDLHLIHEVTSPQAFAVLAERGLAVRRPELTLATMDHSTPTRTEQVFGGAPIAIESAAKQIRELERNCARFGVELPSSAPRSPARRSFVATAIRAPMARSARSPLASALPKSATFSPRNLCYRENPRALRSILITGCSRASQPRTSSFLSSAGSAFPAAPATSSSIAAQA